MQRLDRLQRRHSGLGFVIAVLYKYFDDYGNYLAALITYYAFLSLFPLLLLATTALGWILAGDPHLQHTILSTGLRDFPVIGAQLSDPKRIGGGIRGLIIGLLGAAYGGLGVAQAFQYAMNTAWSVPRNNRPNPFKARGRSVLLLATGGLGVVATTALSTIGASNAAHLGLTGKVLILIASVLLNAAVFSLAFQLATAIRLSRREILPGAITGALAWQLLQTFGVAYVTHIVRHSSATNAVFAVVLGLLGFLYLSATAVLLCVEINVVRSRKLYPRALLTPFTDNVDLTAGDRLSYTGQATAQRSKGFETIKVSFQRRRNRTDPPPTEPGQDD